MAQNSNEETPVAAPAGASADPDFAKVIEKSKDRISAVQSERREKAEKRLRRGRGRPRKDGRPTGSGPLPPGSAFSSTTTESRTETPVVPAPSIAPFLKQPLVFVSKIPANNYKIPELALSDDEATACAQSLDMVVQAFVPNIGEMSPQTAAVISATSVIGSIGFQKYMIFRTKMNERQMQAEAASATSPPPETAPETGSPAFPVTSAKSTTPAADYFRG